MANTIPLSVPDDLLEEVRETARETQMSVQDVFRQSTRLGLPALRASLKPAVRRPQRLSLWDALHCGRGIDLDIKPLPGKVKKVVL